MAFDSTIVTAVGGSSVGDVLAFDGDWLQAGHLGTAMRIRDTAANVYRYAQIIEVISSRSCRVSWAGAGLPLNQPTTNWEESALSPVRGYARSVCLYQQRLVFGGTGQAGSLLLMSVTGQFRNFDLGEAKDSDAIAVIAAGGVRIIRHVAEGQYLTILTENGSTYLVVDANKALTPTNARVQQISPHGVGNARPAPFDSGMLMVTDGGLAVRDIAYSTLTENVQAEPISLPATGFLGGIVDAAFLSGSNERPEELAFFVNAKGRMAVFHSIRSQKVGAWFEWTTYGSWTACAVAGKKLFAVVIRVSGVYSIERFDFGTPFDASVPFGPDAAPDTRFITQHLPAGLIGHASDSSGSYLGSGTIEADHGWQVTTEIGELADLGTGTGQIGIAFGWWIDPLPPAVDLPDGSMLLRFQRLVRSSLRLLEAHSAVNGGQALLLRASADDVAAAPPAATRWWTTTHLGWARRDADAARLTPRITRDIPMPVAVLAYKREVKV